jgi:tetratricopeptide (TPR) repeat protein
VATLLEGSVRKSGNRVRISVQLVKVADSAHLWSETYDRTLDDIFAVQDEIAQAVVWELQRTLMADAPGALFAKSSMTATSSAALSHEIANAAKGRTTNAEAHRLLMQARFLISRAGELDLVKGVDYARQALTIDPNFAMAWTWLSRGLTFAAALGVAPVVEANNEARAAALKALALEPDLVDAHVALVWHKNLYEWDWRGAEAVVQRALTLAPDDADALASAAMLYHALGQNEKSLAYAWRSIDLDPLNQRNWREVAQTLTAMGRHTEAEATFRKQLEFSPHSVNLRGRLALNLERQGRHQEAIAMAESEPADWSRWNALGIIHALQGNFDLADKPLNCLIEKLAGRAAVQIAMNYAARRDADNTFLWLERAYAQRDSGLAFLKSNWIYESLYDDPRWMAFLKKMGREG